MITKHSDPKSWRDVLKVHPAAQLFPLMKDTDPEELRKLADDIQASDLQETVAIYNDPKLGACLLDGRNRLDALELLGQDVTRCSPEFGIWHFVGQDNPNFDPYAYVLSKNVHRRHLTAEDRRELIAKVLKAKPELSDLQISKQTKSSDKTVTSVRRKLEANSEIPNKPERVEADGRKARGRKPNTEVKQLALAAGKSKPESKSAFQPFDTDLNDFNVCVECLLQRTGKQKPERFAGTSVSADGLDLIGDFLKQVAAAKRSSAPPETIPAPPNSTEQAEQSAEKRRAVHAALAASTGEAAP